MEYFLITPADFRKAHEARTDHAFSCADTHQQAYNDAIDDGYAPHEAHRIAGEKHDRSVVWARENVGLN